MNKDNRLQIFTTILAYALPVLQLLLALLSTDEQKIFLFKDNFVVVSVVAAILSYLVILLLKIFPYFQYTPFQAKRKSKIREWDQSTNRFVNNFSKAEVKKYIKDNTEPGPLFTLNADNIVPRVLIPLFIFSFLSFLILGSLSDGFRGGHTLLTTIFAIIQSFNYLALICSAVASFTLFYYRNKSQRDYDSNQASTYKRARILARQHNTFNELQTTRLIAQKELRANPVNPLIVFLMQVGSGFYILATNMSITKVEICVEYSSLEEAFNSYNDLGA
jgi:hypothetical protein